MKKDIKLQHFIGDSDVEKGNPRVYGLLVSHEFPPAQV